jgi:hypothetical protein
MNGLSGNARQDGQFVLSGVKITERVDLFLDDGEYTPNGFLDYPPPKFSEASFLA